MSDGEGDKDDQEEHYERPKNFNDTDFELSESSEELPAPETDVEAIKKILGEKFVDCKGNELGIECVTGYKLIMIVHYVNWV